MEMRLHRNPLHHVFKMAYVRASSETEDDDPIVQDSEIYVGNETIGFRCTYPGCSSVMKYRKHVRDHFRSHTVGVSISLLILELIGM